MKVFKKFYLTTGHTISVNLRSVIEASIEKAENDVLAENEVLIGERRVSAMMSDDDSEGIRLDESKGCGKTYLLRRR